MEKRCLRQLKALINSFTFYPKRFLKKPLYKALWPKRPFLSEIAHPLLDRKVNLRQKIFHGYLSWNWLYQSPKFQQDLGVTPGIHPLLEG